MTAKNDVTGDALRSRGPSKAYEDGWDRIFGKKNEKKSEESDKSLISNEKEIEKNS